MAVNVILIHNHPSGNPNPSDDDLKVTHQVNDAGKLIGIRLTDHIIIGDNTYYSFKEWGTL
jgi:DNA repair protein RadC